MYTTCLFCSKSLGANEVLETFSVGSRLAFDSNKGRLWAVCRRCGRWNLAPIEERWEAVEAAERLFTNTRSRVQSENIGLCRLADGTRLIRVGAALPGELAVWRYGGELISRRNRNLAVGGAMLVGIGALVAGLPLIASAGVPFGVVNAGLQVNVQVQLHRQRRRVVHHIPAGSSRTGHDLIVRREHLYQAVLAPTDDGDIGIRLPEPGQLHPWKQPAAGWKPTDTQPLHITGAAARRVLARAMTDYNASGARKSDVQQALRLIEDAHGAESFARTVAQRGTAITRPARLAPARRSRPYSLRQIAGTFRGDVLPVDRYRSPFTSDERPQMSRIEALALEMALHEEAERDALRGELAALEAAWREAEEIAAIADALPEPRTGDGPGSGQQQE